MKVTKVLIFLALFSLILGTSCKKSEMKDDSKHKNGITSESEEIQLAKNSESYNYSDAEKSESPKKGYEGMSAAEISRASRTWSSHESYDKGAVTKKTDPGYYSKPKLKDESDDMDSDGRDEKKPRDDSIKENRSTGYFINKFVKTTDSALSTFAIDVDTASYTIMRGAIKSGHLPKPSSVRVEEYINYFDYKYPAPSTGLFAVYSQMAENPFNYGETTLLRVALRAKDISKTDRRTAHLTFMIDVSGSMQASNKLPLVKQTLKTLIKNLRDDDTIAICTYSTQAVKVLEATRIKDKDVILAAIEPLYASGSTNGQAGMHNAYELANDAFVKGHINRIIMCTDGDFNVGVTSGKSLAEEVNHFAQKGITLSAVGYGMGNDRTLESIADAGNGNYFYIDSIEEINRVFGENLVSTLDVVAADVKIQLEFNPKLVSEYRLVGYENRALTAEQFRDDIVDAGEVGAGHSVTAIYDLKLGGTADIDTKIPEDLTGYAAIFRIRYKEQITDEKAKEANFTVDNTVLKFEKADSSFKFAVGVMGFADILRASPFAKGWRINTAIDCCNNGKTKSSTHADGFIELMRKAISMRDK